jgi:chlorite dismutase
MRERGGPRDGEPQYLDRRLFMHFRAYGALGSSGPPELEAAIGSLEHAPCGAVVYADLHDPTGLAVVFVTDSPEELAGPVRDLLARPPWTDWRYKPEHTMLGRTYGLGYEPDLDDALLHRPLRTIMNASWPWAVWYPLRRTGAYALLPEEERRAILREHGAIGMAFGRADLAHDIRLACYGLDPADNDFVVGLVGPELHPLSAVVEAMRSTRQTAQFIERLGPFFVGRAVWRHQPDQEPRTAP